MVFRSVVLRPEYYILLIIIPKCNAIKEHCHEMWKTQRCPCNNENSSKLFLYCWQVIIIAVELFTVVFCPKQRKGNGLKLEIIGIAFLCFHFLLQIAKDTFVVWRRTSFLKLYSHLNLNELLTFFIARC